MPRLKEFPRMSESAIAGALRQQEDLGGPFLRALSEPLYESLQPSPADFMNLVSPLPVGMFRSQIYKIMRKAYPELKGSAIAKSLKGFNMRTLDPLEHFEVLPEKEIEKLDPQRSLSGAFHGPGYFGTEIPKETSWARAHKRPISSFRSSPYAAALKGQPSIVLSETATYPLRTMRHEIAHLLRELLGPGARYKDIEFAKNPEEAIADAIAHRSIGVDRGRVMEELRYRFDLPDDVLSRAIDAADESLVRMTGKEPFVHYESLPERTSIAKHRAKERE